MSEQVCGCGATATRLVDGVGWCCDVHFPDPTPEQRRAARLATAERDLLEAVLLRHRLRQTDDPPADVFDERESALERAIDEQDELVCELANAVLALRAEAKAGG